MNKGTCTVEGCDKPSKTRGWCSAHYHRWQRHGDPHLGGVRINGTPLDRFRFYNEPGNGDECDRWGAFVNAHGYAALTVNGQDVPAHRWIWEHTNGPIPNGLMVDHACHNEAAARGECAGGPACPHRACTRLDHLTLATSAENSWASANFNGNKTHCPSGHAYDDENTRITPDGRRRCRACARASALRRYWRLRNA